MRTLFLCLNLMVAMLSCAQATDDGAWSTTWGTSPEYTGEGDMPKTSLAGKTLRMVIHPTIAGDTIRLRLSNFHSDEPVEIKFVYIASDADSIMRDNHTGDFITKNGCSSKISKGAEYFTFNGGSKSVTIKPHENVTSDALGYNFRDYHNLAITIIYGDKVPVHATSHRGSRTTSYIANGEVGPNEEFKTVESVEHWYNILSLEVKRQTPVVAVLGNSITDGRGTTTNAQNRWTDIMGIEIGNMNPYLDGSIRYSDGCGVVNMGIGGNCVLEGGISEPLIKRYKDELGFHSGITHLIIYEGTNDIGTSPLAPDTLSEKLIAAYKEIINYAHSKGIKVYLATITPTKGNGWYSPTHEQARQLVNKWIRLKQGFEGIIDFDELVRDPQDSEKLKVEYSDDWLHLNPRGYEVMGRYAANIIGKDLGFLTIKNEGRK